jgi:trans-aconitate methyltransferase
VGIDASQVMITKAKTSFTNQEYPNLVFQKMDAQQLNFDNAFEVVFSNSTLHWIKDHRPVLKGIYYALKPGGTTFLKFGGKGTLDSFQPMIDIMLNRPKWAPYFNRVVSDWAFFDDKTYLKWLKDSGFTPISVKRVHSDMIHNNRNGLAGWIRTTWHPYLSLIPENLKTDFITELVDRYLEKYPVDSEGRSHVDMVRLEIEATKVQ